VAFFIFSRFSDRSHPDYSLNIKADAAKCSQMQPLLKSRLQTDI
jgi:hypothetical protein